MKITDEEMVANILKFNKEVTELNVKYSEEIERLNNIIKQQDTRNSRQRVANKELQDRFNSLMEAHKICDEENFRLDNIINELEKWLKDEKEATVFDYHFAIEDVLNKIKELKGEDKE